MNQFGFWINVRLLQSKGLADSQAGDCNQQDKRAVGLFETAPDTMGFFWADDLRLVFGRGHALHFPGRIATVRYQFAPRSNSVDQRHQSLQMIDRPVRQAVVALEFLEPVLDCVMRDFRGDVAIPLGAKEPLQIHLVGRDCRAVNLITLLAVE